MENNSFIHPNAKIGANVQIGPFCYIAENVEIGDGCQIGPHATIFDYVKMGKNCKVFPGAVIGAVPQDMKFHGEITYVEIGDNVTIRECATINRGTEASGKGITKIGNNTLVMSYVHVAHDCVIGDNVIMSNNATLAGHVKLGNWAIVGGLTAVHQFTRIGAHAMVGGMCGITRDVVPYSLIAANALEGVNIVGLKRRGFSLDVINRLRHAVDEIFNEHESTLAERVEKVASEYSDCEPVMEIVHFMQADSKRGFTQPLEHKG